MFRVLLGFWFSIIKCSVCGKLAIILLKLSGLPEEVLGALWERTLAVSGRGMPWWWTGGGIQAGNSERGCLMCVFWGWGLCLRKDVYSGVANYLNRHSESRAQFGSVLHFLGTFDPSSLILTSTKICEHKVCPFSPWFLNLIMWRILKGYINIINHIISCMFK